MFPSSCSSSFGGAHLRVHLQEHQRHFPLRREVGPPSQLRLHALARQPEALSHLVERQKSLHPSQLGLFKGGPVKVIKIKLRESNVWCYFSKISYF